MIDRLMSDVDVVVELWIDCNDDRALFGPSGNKRQVVTPL